MGAIEEVSHDIMDRLKWKTITIKRIQFKAGMKTVRQYIDDEMIEDKSERRWV